MSRITLDVWAETPPQIDEEVKLIRTGLEPVVYRLVSVERLSDHPRHYELEADDGVDDFRYVGNRGPA